MRGYCCPALLKRDVSSEHSEGSPTEGLLLPCDILDRIFIVGGPEVGAPHRGVIVALLYPLLLESSVLRG